MKKNQLLELWVGLFLALGVVCLGFLSVGVAKRNFFQPHGYEVKAAFDNCTGLRAGSVVVLAGVEVGRVKAIGLKDYEAQVLLQIQPSLVLQRDVIASIRTQGLIGEKFIELTPGSATESISPGGIIHNTESTVDLESLVSKMVHGSAPSSAP